MTRKLPLVAFAFGVVGCTPFVVKDNIVGPHGEQLVELTCATPDDCMAFAREVCQGDFDIATNDYTQPTHLNIGSGNDLMMVHCTNPPGHPPPAPRRAAPDAGP